jgi:hypothetical protein
MIFLGHKRQAKPLKNSLSFLSVHDDDDGSEEEGRRQTSYHHHPAFFKSEQERRKKVTKGSKNAQILGHTESESEVRRHDECVNNDHILSRFILPSSEPTPARNICCSVYKIKILGWLSKVVG